MSVVEVEALIEVELAVMETVGAAPALTARVAVPVTPEEVAEMVAVPAATPVARPVGPTVATAELDDVHVTPDARVAVVPLL
jgi:hypothetical protein